ncbi:MAG: DUF3526 domain-containing protein [Pseudomonadota bacterium]
MANLLPELLRELRFALSERTVVYVLVATVALSSLALIAGLANVAQQSARLHTLLPSIENEKEQALAAQSDVGSAAYYVFHLTYDLPSDLAFVALGMRDELPWLHRVRMLALEGQIYENDPGNPELSSLGDLDFAYLVSIILPLLLIGLLYDLDARERRDARYELLYATSARGGRVLHIRGLARTLLLLGAILIPLITIALVVGRWHTGLIAVVLAVIIHAMFWLIVSRLIAVRVYEASTAAAVLLGAWLLMTVLIPVMGKYLTERAIDVPHGGNILFLQRETVNDAWDLPKIDTMDAFASRHPEWKDVTIEKPFEWRWYYAFQQVGDQEAEPLSVALEDGMRERARWMSRIALLSPPLLVEQWLTKLAKTDTRQHMAYMRCVRDFHSSLREFHYPMMFGRQEFNEINMSKLPQFKPCGI